MANYGKGIRIGVASGSLPEPVPSLFLCMMIITRFLNFWFALFDFANRNAILSITSEYNKCNCIFRTVIS